MLTVMLTVFYYGDGDRAWHYFELAQESWLVSHQENCISCVSPS
ncbi:hypothetical protein [Piscirickettsia salmonis]